MGVRHVLRSEWKKTMWYVYIYIVKFCLAIKNNRVMSFTKKI